MKTSSDSKVFSRKCRPRWHARSAAKSRWILLFLGLVVGLGAQIEVVSGGNVGIGTSTPSALLHVSKVGVTTSTDILKLVGAYDSFNLGGALTVKAVYHSGYGSDYDFNVGRWNGSDYTNHSLLNLNATGNVGIGTTNPGKKLEVVGAMVSRDSSAAAGRAIALQADSAGAKLWLNGSYDPSNSGSGWGARMTFLTNGHVGIGTNSPSQKLEVAGSVRATSFISNTTTYADFVFKPDYKLPSLSEVEAHIAEHGTLPGVPSEAQVAKEGIDLAAMQVKLLQKIEELTLHVIRQEKEIQALKAKHGSN